MALELHPDKGGDPEKFQELQEMKERLTELEADEKKSDEEKAEEEEAKAKEKEKEEEEEKQKLSPDERIRKLRMEVHDNTVRLWERAKKSKDEIVGEKAIKANAQPALNILRMFVERFVNNEIKLLRHDDVKGADAKFRKFVKQGSEIIAVAAIHDVQSTLQTIAMQFNYKLVARSGSKEINAKCQALLQAVADVPVQCEAFMKRLEDNLSEARDREKKSKEERAREQKEREARGDFSGEANPKGASKAAPKTSPPPKAAPKSKAATPAATPAGAKPGVEDPFGDFDFGSKAAPKARPAPPTKEAEVSVAKREDERSTIAAAMKPRATCWDPKFDHPYAGALRANGQGIFCRPCQRWINCYDYDTETFLTHVERVHPKPPPGWSG